MNAIQEESLVAELAAWCAYHGLPHESADELLDREDLTVYHSKWLYDYCNRWDFAAKGHYWINGVHVPSDYPEHREWITSPEFAEFFADWGLPIIPEGFNAYHDDTNLKPGLTVRKAK